MVPQVVSVASAAEVHTQWSINGPCAADQEPYKRENTGTHSRPLVPPAKTVHANKEKTPRGQTGRLACQLIDKDVS
jgi:hypothetical protein